MSARKIAAWHEAGLIDAITRDRLLAYEAEHARPLALWAVFGIGALAIGAGAGLGDRRQLGGHSGPRLSP